MIKSIVLNNCVPYNHAELTDCRKINFIFGPNGSGKTTIGDFLDDNNNTRFATSNIIWDVEKHESIYVYNKAFRKRNFKQTVPGIFTIGSATIEEINELDGLKEEYKDLVNKNEKYYKTLENKKRENEECENQFKNDAWQQILKKYENDFKKAFDGCRSNKNRFITELKRRIVDKCGEICDFSDLKSRADILFHNQNDKVEYLNFENEEGVIIRTIETNPVWKKVIVGNKDIQIGKLISRLENSSWVNAGRKYIQPNSNICPFCQNKTITDQFVTELESFFDEEYEEQINNMQHLLKEYEKATNNTIDALDSLLNNNDSIAIGNLDVDNFRTRIDLLNKNYNLNIRKIQEKLSDPSIKIELQSNEEMVESIRRILEEVNARIRKNNNLIDKREIEEVNLKNDIWATCIDGASSLIGTYKQKTDSISKGLKGIQTAIDENEKKIRILDQTIKEKSRKITSIQPSIDAINRYLKLYGFTGFEIIQANDLPNQYSIKREDGSSAIETLSEGEETFLTFLYFMQQTKGAMDQDKVSDKKIIVLDDPVSSLDSSVLYIVGAMVKELSKEILRGDGDVVQMFLLTHNVFFHKEASFDPRNNMGKNVKFWMVKKNDGISTIHDHGNTNPISTSYELLWKDLREDSSMSIITIQNAMRRIIENYFRMIGNNIDDQLEKNFEKVEEKMICRSLLYWINDNSHSIPDEYFVDSYNDAISVYKKVFKEIFRVSGHLSHYNMMMKIETES